MLRKRILLVLTFEKVFTGIKTYVTIFIRVFYFSMKNRSKKRKIVVGSTEVK